MRNFDRDFARTRRRIDRAHSVVSVGVSGVFLLILLAMAGAVYWVSTSAKSDLGAAVEWFSERWHAGK